MQKTNRIKRNSPIVVCLKDSIRLAAAAAGGGTKGARAKAPSSIRNISHNRTTSSSSSSSSSSQVADSRRRDKQSREQEGQRQQEEEGQKEEERKRQEDSLPAYISFSSSASAAPPPPPPCSSFSAGKGSKNFNAFLSAIEKVHTKDERPPLSAQNLNHPSISSSSFSDARERAAEATREPQGAAEVVVLNNAAIIGPTEAALALDAVRTAFAERDNVEVICNDLHSSRTNPTVEGSEDSDISSCHPSSSDSSSSDAEDQDRGVPEEEEEEEELSKEELDRLSEHANGFAMRRYELPPHECPECLAAYFAYTHYYAQGSKFFKIEVVDRDDDTVHWSPDSQPDSVFEYPLPTDPSHAAAPGLATAATAREARTRQKVNHIGQPHCHLPLPPFHRHIDTVSLDLTGSDVTFTVEQHPVDGTGSQPPGGSTTQQSSATAAAANTEAAGNPELYGHNFYCTMFGFVPCVPGYCFIPAFYFMFPMWTIPKLPVMTTTSQPPRAKQPQPKDDYDSPFYARESIYVLSIRRRRRLM